MFLAIRVIILSDHHDLQLHNEFEYRLQERYGEKKSHYQSEKKYPLIEVVFQSTLGLLAVAVAVAVAAVPM
jgi:hypothetical protein